MGKNTQLVQALDERISSEDWAAMAAQSDLSGPELRREILEGIVDYDLGLFSEKQLAVRVSEEIAAGECTSKDFEISAADLVAIGGTVKLCGGSSDWSMDIDLYVKVAGSKIGEYKIRLNSEGMDNCISMESLFCKGKYCAKADVHSDKICFTLYGAICLWLGGWKCLDFNTGPICIPW